MQELLKEVDGLGLGNVNLLALITKNSSDVVFYTNIEGRMLQSNTLVESGAFDAAKMRDFYQRITDLIRESSDFNPEMMNVVKVSGAQVSISYETLNCSVVSLKKAWRDLLLGMKN